VAAEETHVTRTIQPEIRYGHPTRYATYEFVDETHSSDPLGRWDGADSYYRTYRCRVPRTLLARAIARGGAHQDALRDWILAHEDRGIWL
jgi:hypothetical protein